MVNGKPGDNPLTDLFLHNLHPFSPIAEALLREIRELAGASEWNRLEDSLKYSQLPRDGELEERLRALRDRLRREAKERGWEVV